MLCYLSATHDVHAEMCRWIAREKEHLRGRVRAWLNTSILEGKDILHMAAQDFQRRIDTPFRHMEGSHHIIKGDFITYLLPPEMQPSNPLREWHGKVEATYPNGWVLVTILDKGYAGETE